MSSLILPRQFYNQPQGTVQVDWSNPLTAGLRRVVLPSVSLSFDLAEGSVITTTPNIKVWQGGLAQYCEAVGNAVTVPSWTNVKSEASAVLVQQRASTDNNYWLDLSLTTAGDHFLYNSAVYTDAFAAARWLSSGLPASANILSVHNIILTSSSGSQAAYYNGALFATGTQAYSHPSNLVFGKSVNSNSFLGWLYLAAYYDRVISAGEAASLSANPWQLFRAKSRVLYFDVGGASGATISPPLLTNSQTFPGATLSTGAVTVSPALLTNSQTFPAATISQGAISIQPALLTNAQTFYAATVSAGAVSVVAPLVSNAQTFPGATVSVGSVTVSPALLTNSQTFPAPVVTQDGGPQFVSPALITNSQTFPAATVSPGSVDILPALLTNAQVWYAPTVSNGGIVLSPPLLTNSQTFPGATITTGSVSVLPALLTNDQIFFGATVYDPSLVLPLYPITRRTLAAAPRVTTITASPRQYRINA